MLLRLPAPAHDALVELARRERRDVKAQAELLIIAALHRRGLVTRDGLERIRDTEPTGAAS